MDPELPALPWWRIRMVWLVFGGPALVVIASCITLVLAIRGGDPPVPTTAAAAHAVEALTPATQARNHAASRR